jgi:(S)-ureidoglycine aminohydrolase
VAIVHCAPALGAAFTQYTAEMEAGGKLGLAIGQRFLYVLDGRLQVDGTELGRGGFAFFAEADAAAIEVKADSRVAVFEKQYRPVTEAAAPSSFTGHEHHIAATALAGDPELRVRSLIPDDVAFDFAVNTMTYQPGAALSMVEIHVMEHGLLMLEGGGIYRVGDAWYPVAAGDFIWMAPYCPQWFGALGKVPAKYLIYKDWNRHPL